MIEELSKEEFAALLDCEGWVYILTECKALEIPVELREKWLLVSEAFNSLWDLADHKGYML